MFGFSESWACEASARKLARRANSRLRILIGIFFGVVEEEVTNLRTSFSKGVEAFQDTELPRDRKRIQMYFYRQVQLMIGLRLLGTSLRWIRFAARIAFGGRFLLGCVVIEWVLLDKTWPRLVGDLGPAQRGSSDAGAM